MTALVLSRTGSYRSAVRETGQSFKTLSKRIAALEERLGFPLFHTTRNGLVVTAEGMTVIAQAERIAEGVDHLRGIADRAIESGTSQFTISTTSGSGAYWVMPRIAEFHAAHPDIHLRIVTGKQTEATTQPEADISLQYREPTAPDVMRQKLARVHFVLCASEEYLATNGVPTTAEELAGHQFVFLEPALFAQRKLVEAFLQRSLPPVQTVEVSHAAYLFLAIEHGGGIGFTPTFILAAERRMKVIEVDLHQPIDLWICYAENARQNPRLSLTIDWLIQLFEPRSNPWFRSDFINPREFPAQIEKLGSQNTVNKHRFNNPV